MVLQEKRNWEMNFNFSVVSIDYQYVDCYIDVKNRIEEKRKGKEKLIMHDPW
jgi:hypothetical protein